MNFYSLPRVVSYIIFYPLLRTISIYTSKDTSEDTMGKDFIYNSEDSDDFTDNVDNENVDDGDNQPISMVDALALLAEL